MSMNKLPQVIYWKYGPVADCDWDNALGKWEIAKWRHPTLPQPDADQLALDVAEYVAARIEEKEKIRQLITTLDEPGKVRSTEAKSPR